MGLIKLLFTKNRDIKSKKQFKDKTQVPWNIYNAKEAGSYLKKFHIIHFRFKYKFLVPGIMLMRKLFKKQLNQPIPDEWYNKDIKIFDEAFEEAIRQWLESYVACCRPKEEGLFAKPEDVEDWYKNKDSVEALRTMKKATVMIALNDTAYREFISCLIHKIAQKTLDEYKGKENYHLIYNSKDTFDVLYYVIGKELQKSGRPTITLRPARPNEVFRTDDIRCFLKQASAEALKDLLKMEGQNEGK